MPLAEPDEAGWDELTEILRPERSEGSLMAYLFSLGHAGCARMVAAGGALALALGAVPSTWAAVPVDIEDSTRAVVDAQDQERAGVEDLLAERSNVPPRDRARVARAIVEESAQAKLDPVFILALMTVESELDEGAVSSVGARGLMQLRPGTESYLGAKEKLGLGAETTGDPALDVRVGVRYLHRLMRAFGGDLSVALVAYNAGPHRVSGYIHEQNHVPYDYPKRVRAAYRRLLGQVADGSLHVAHPLHIRVASR